MQNSLGLVSWQRETNLESEEREMIRKNERGIRRWWWTGIGRKVRGRLMKNESRGSRCRGRRTERKTRVKINKRENNQEKRKKKKIIFLSFSSSSLPSSFFKYLWYSTSTSHFSSTNTWVLQTIRQTIVLDTLGRVRIRSVFFASFPLFSGFQVLEYPLFFFFNSVQIDLKVNSRNINNQCSIVKTRISAF